MKKVTMYEALDGTVWATETEAGIADAKHRLAELVEHTMYNGIDTDDIVTVLTDNAVAFVAVLEELGTD